jgi:hypothetical protein
MLSKNGASLLQRVRLDKLELRQFHFLPPALVVHPKNKAMLDNLFDGLQSMQSLWEI